MIYVYAPSMAIITWAAKRWLWDKIIIISGNSQVLKFCKQCKISYVEIQKNEDTSYKGLLKHKKYVTNFALQFSNCNFIFGHNSHDYWGLYFIKCLNKSNTVYYNPQLNEHPKIKFIYALTRKKTRNLIKDIFVLMVALKVKFDILKFEEYYFIGINAKRLNHKFSGNITKSENSTFLLNQKQVLGCYQLKEPEFVLIDQGEVFYSFTDELIQSIIKISKIKQNFFLKQHPNFKTKNVELLHGLKQIPDEIPIELLLNEDTTVIGIASNALREASISISLIHLLMSDKEQIAQYTKIINYSAIIFPKSIKEFEDLIYNKSN